MKKIIVFFLGLTFCATFLFAQDIERNVKERLTGMMKKSSVCRIRILS